MRAILQDIDNYKASTLAKASNKDIFQGSDFVQQDKEEKLVGD